MHLGTLGSERKKEGLKYASSAVGGGLSVEN